MTPSACLALVIMPALRLLPPRMTSDAAKVQLLAIGLQESSLCEHKQIGGPARGLWQFERGGGVRGVLGSPRTATYAATLCIAQGVQPNEHDVYEALAGDDILAAAFARLLLWTDSHPLPSPGDAGGAWDYYVRNWRPGKPRPDDWAHNYSLAMAAVQ